MKQVDGCLTVTCIGGSYTKMPEVSILKVCIADLEFTCVCHWGVVLVHAAHELVMQLHNFIFNMISHSSCGRLLQMFLLSVVLPGVICREAEGCNLRIVAYSEKIKPASAARIAY